MNVASSNPALRSVIETGVRGVFCPGDIVLPRGRCDRCHIVTEGIVSIRFGNSAIEVDLIGPGELLNVGALLHTNANEHFAVALSECETLSISVEDLQRLTDRHPQIYPRLLRYVQRRLVQSMRAAECHLTHTVEQRLACWIALAAEMIEQTEVAVTHKELSAVLGVQRPTVTLALQQLEGYGAIRSRRGRIVVRSHAHLVSHACECFAARSSIRKASVAETLLTGKVRSLRRCACEVIDAGFGALISR